MASEFDLIRRFFERPARFADLGVGDDCALLHLSPGSQLAVSCDMLVENRHFFSDVDPDHLGHKTLAVNLSDLAAMGATPRYATLALALPEANEAWLAAFSQGFFRLADQYGVELIGGDTTRGPLNLCVQIMGEVPRGAALRRDGARPGDDIWVSGDLGGAAAALACMQNRLTLPPDALADCRERLEMPQPRVALGLALRGVASAAIDLSDGLLADLGHLVSRSAVGAQIELARLPVARALASAAADPLIQQCLLAGGDDYELCFTAPVARRQAIADLGLSLALPLTRIGSIDNGSTVSVIDANGTPLMIKEVGFDHFRS